MIISSLESTSSFISLAYSRSGLDSPPYSLVKLSTHPSHHIHSQHRSLLHSFTPGSKLRPTFARKLKTFYASATSLHPRTFILRFTNALIIRQIFPTLTLGLLLYTLDCPRDNGSTWDWARLIMLISLFFLSFFFFNIFLFIPCGRLSWLSIRQLFNER